MVTMDAYIRLNAIISFSTNLHNLFSQKIILTS